VSDTTQLWFYCTAAGHGEETCESWPQHRQRLELKYRSIELQLEYVEAMIKVGKARQEAGHSGQASVTGRTFDKPDFGVQMVQESPPKGKYRVDWRISPTTGKWYTQDIRLEGRHFYHKEDVRAYVIAHCRKYGLEPEIYFNGEPDEWNGKRGIVTER